MVTCVDLNEFQLSKEEKYHWSKGTSLSILYSKSFFLSDNALNRSLCCDNTLDGRNVFCSSYIKYRIVQEKNAPSDISFPRSIIVDIVQRAVSVPEW